MRAQHQYVDERLRTLVDDEQKLHQPRAARFRPRLLPVLALIALAAVPLLLLDHKDPVADREREQAAGGRHALTGALEEAQPEIMAPSPPAAASAVVRSIQPPYSAQGDCRRDYDRNGRGDGFARCGSSCCRSSAGILCYYKADPGLCDRFLLDGAANERAARDGANGDVAGGDSTGGKGGKGDSERDEPDDGGGGGPDPFAHQVGAGAAAAAQLPRDAVSDTAASAIAADAANTVQSRANAALAPDALESLVPMIRPPADADDAMRTRRPRMMRYPSFNLTWTRGAPPPRSDGWAPSEAQRLRLPSRDLKEQYYASCAVVGSSGTLRRRGYGRYIDAHEVVMRFNGAPAGGGYAADVGSRTSLAVLADVATTECVDNKSRQPTLERATARMEGHLLSEPAPGWRSVRQCDFYPDAQPPALLVFLPRRGGVRRLLDYSLEHPSAPMYIRSDALADEVDAQVGAYADDTSHPTSGFNGVSLALHICETVDLYGFGSPRDKFYSPPRAEKSGAQHLYRTEMRWMLGLERRYPGRVRLWP